MRPEKWLLNKADVDLEAAERCVDAIESAKEFFQPRHLSKLCSWLNGGINPPGFALSSEAKWEMTENRRPPVAIDFTLSQLESSDRTVFRKVCRASSDHRRVGTGRLKPEYSLPFDLPEVPTIGAWISITRPDSKLHSEDLVVRATGATTFAP